MGKMIDKKSKDGNGCSRTMYKRGEKGGKLYKQKKKSAIFIENDVQMCRSDIRRIGGREGEEYLIR